MLVENKGTGWSGSELMGTGYSDQSKEKQCLSDQIDFPPLITQETWTITRM